MATQIQVIPSFSVKRCLRYYLIQKKKWTLQAEISDESELFDPPEPASEHSVPAHLGFAKGSGVTMEIITAVAENLLGKELLNGRRIPFRYGEPDNILDFKTLHITTQRRLNSLVITTIGNRIVRKVVSDWIGDDVDEIDLGEAPPKWSPGSHSVDKFVGDLIIALKDKMPDINENAFDPDVVQKIKAAKTLFEIRTIILKKSVKPTLKKRIDACVCVMEG